MLHWPPEASLVIVLAEKNGHEEREVEKTAFERGVTTSRSSIATLLNKKQRNNCMTL